jgi:hypothetical protein
MVRHIAIILFILPVILVAQNRIPNPGFEKKNGCPESPGQINLANFWVSPNIATPDYFNDCSSGLDYGTEFNKKGGQLAHTGNAYAGLQFYSLNRNDFYEYMETRLDSALIQDQLYCIRAFVSLGKSDYAFRELGAVLSVTEVKSPDARKLKLPYVSIGNGDYLLEQEKWMCISGLYKAKGNERLITIGDFSKKDQFWNIHTQSETDSLFKSTFYFIDDLSLVPVSDSSDCHCR